MKAVIIGTSGHYEYAFDALDFGVNITGIAKGHVEEKLEKCVCDFEQRNHNPKVYDDVVTMLDEEKPDIAVINTITSLNCEYAMMCLKRNINVFCEKPLAMNLQELEELKRVYDDANSKGNVQLSCMFGISYERNFVTIQKYLKNKSLGEIRLIQTQKSYKLGNRDFYYKSKETFPGIIPWVSIHGLDWMMGVCGVKFDKVYSVQSDKYNNNHGDLETSCSSIFSNEDGVIGICTSDYFRPSVSGTHGDDRMRVVCTKGIIETEGGKVYIQTKTKKEVPLFDKKSIFGDFVNALAQQSVSLKDFEYSYNVTKAILIARMSAEKGELLKI